MYSISQANLGSVPTQAMLNFIEEKKNRLADYYNQKKHWNLQIIGTNLENIDLLNQWICSYFSF